MARTGFMR